MILGAGEFQIPIIKEVQRQGFRAVVVSSPGNYPGFVTADQCYEIDVRDKDAVLVAARNSSICGILTDQTDVAVPTVAYVAEQLGLPGIGYECALKFTDKFLMRQAALQLGIPVPHFFEASDILSAEREARTLRYPLIVKPVNSQGSRGVALVSDSCELAAKVKFAQSFSSEHRVIIEEFFEGLEVVIEGFASNFGFLNIAVGDRSYFDLPGVFIPRSTVFPSTLPPELVATLLEYNQRLICGLKPRFGITHTEFLINTRSGDIRLVETAIRGGGVFISSDLVPLASGIDVGKLLVQHATGKKDGTAINGNMKTMIQKAAGYHCFCLPQGVITHVSGVEAVKAIHGVRRAVLERLQVGFVLPALSDKTGRLGPIIITGNDLSECEQTLCRVRRTLHIEVQTERGLETIRW